MTATPIMQDEIVAIEATTLFVRGLRIGAEVGVHEHERGRRQTLLIDVDLLIRPVCGTTLADTLDYAVVLKETESIATSGHIMLVETFAERLGRALLCYPPVEGVTVRIAKPAALAPVADAAGAEVVMVRRLG